MTQTIEALNRAIFLRIDATPDTPRWLAETGLLIANYAIWIVPVVLACMWLTAGSERREIAVRACVVGFVALGINQLIGMAWYHPRPFVMGLGHTLLSHAPDSSFPSDHVTLLSAISFTFLYGGKRSLGALFLAVDIAVAWSRVFVGVHFPFDIVGAAGVAWLSYVLSSALWGAWGSALTRTCVAAYRKTFAWPIGQGWLRP